MQIYAGHWQNGDITIVVARSKDEAMSLLDDLGNVTGVRVRRLRAPFVVDFKPSVDHSGRNQDVWTADMDDGVWNSLCDVGFITPRKEGT